MHGWTQFNSLFECHISNTIKYTNIPQNKTYLIPSLFGLTRHYTLPPTPNWSPYIFTLVQKVKIGH